MLGPKSFRQSPSGSIQFQRGSGVDSEAPNSFYQLWKLQNIQASWEELPEACELECHNVGPGNHTKITKLMFFDRCF